MIPARSFSEPLRSHMIRRRLADARTVAVAALVVLGASLAGLAIGNAVLKALLNLNSLPMVGCC